MKVDTYSALQFWMQGKGSMTTWWIIDRDVAATKALLSPKQKPSMLSLPELVKDAPQRSLKGNVTFRNIAFEDSFDSESQNMLLPGSVIEELN